MMELLPLVAGLIAGIAVFLLVMAASQFSSPLGRRLQTITGIGGEEEAEFDSLAHKLQLAGFRVQAKQAKSFYMLLQAGVFVAIFIAAMLIGLPPLGAAAIGGSGLFLLRGYINSRVEQLRRRCEAELPAALTEIASIIQVQPSITEALARVARTLAISESMLAKEFERAALELSQKGPAAWSEIIARAQVLSPTLAIVMHSLERASKRGGAQFGHAFSAMAERIAASMQARADARAKGQSALAAVRVIALIIVALTAFLAVDPVYRPAVLSVPGQILIAGAILMMAVGYWYCNDKINSLF